MGEGSGGGGGGGCVDGEGGAGGDGDEVGCSELMVRCPVTDVRGGRLENCGGGRGKGMDGSLVGHRGGGNPNGYPDLSKTDVNCLIYLGQ